MFQRLAVLLSSVLTLFLIIELEQTLECCILAEPWCRHLAKKILVHYYTLLFRVLDT
jgi:hypothetical protein